MPPEPTDPTPSRSTTSGTPRRSTSSRRSSPSSTGTTSTSTYWRSASAGGRPRPAVPWSARGRPGRGHAHRRRPRSGGTPGARPGHRRGGRSGRALRRRRVRPVIDPSPFPADPSSTPAPPHSPRSSDRSRIASARLLDEETTPLERRRSGSRTAHRRARAASCSPAESVCAPRSATGRSSGAGGAADDPMVIDAGAAFEMLHGFALVHDDVMDGSATRRGERTVHIEFEEVHVDGDVARRVPAFRRGRRHPHRRPRWRSTPTGS